MATIGKTEEDGAREICEKFGITEEEDIEGVMEILTEVWQNGYQRGVRHVATSDDAEVVKLNLQMENGAECLRLAIAERESLKLQNGELAEAKGNLLDFIQCVLTWAINQPTAMSLRESCLGIIEKYAEKRVEQSPKKCAVCGCEEHSGRCGEQGGSGPEDGYA